MRSKILVYGLDAPKLVTPIPSSSGSHGHLVQLDPAWNIPKIVNHGDRLVKQESADSTNPGYAEVEEEHSSASCDDGTSRPAFAPIEALDTMGIPPDKTFKSTTSSTLFYDAEMHRSQYVKAGSTTNEQLGSGSLEAETLQRKNPSPGWNSIPTKHGSSQINDRWMQDNRSYPSIVTKGFLSNSKPTLLRPNMCICGLIHFTQTQ
jgi:hypothetical protein